MAIEPRSIFRHDCYLPKELSSHIHSPFDSSWKKVWHDLRLKFSIERNVTSKFYFRSGAAMASEQRRHLMNQRYQFIIHPFSSFNRKMEIFFSLNFFVLIILESYFGSFLGDTLYTKKVKTRKCILLYMNCVQLISIIFTFFTGYFVEKTREVVLEPKIIAKTYLKTYFFFDAIAVGSYFVFHFMPLSSSLVVRIFVYELHKLRLARVKIISDTLSVVLKRTRKVNESTETIILIAVLLFIILHEWTCVLGFLNMLHQLFKVHDHETFLENYFKHTERIVDTSGASGSRSGHYVQMSIRIYFLHLSLIMCHFFGCGTHQYQSKCDWETFLLSLVLITGFMYYLCVMAKVLQLYGIVNIAEMKFQEQKVQMDQYMTKKKFATALKKRIHIYYDYKYDNKFFSERQILECFTERLRMEVLLYNCRNLINNVRVFKGLSKSAVGCILALLKHEIYLPGEVVMSAEDTSGSLYFILYGTCKVESENKKELWHLEDGNDFGDTNRFASQLMIGFLYKVIALEPTQVYELELKDLYHCCEMYPELVYKLQGVSTTKALFYNSVYAKRHNEDESTLGEILDELSRGRILRHGITRSDFE